jgi:4a-hydroxytetrahydrobiopterin dehydratase
MDALDSPSVRAFWVAVLGDDEVGDEDVVDPHGRAPSIWFQEMDAPLPQRDRIHIDVFVPRGPRRGGDGRGWAARQ